MIPTGPHARDLESRTHPAARAEWRPVWVALVLSGAVGAWLCAGMPEFAQEAYYWVCSRRFALSYFDHPPLAPWLIAAGTSLFGDGPFGIRVGMLACALATTLVGLRLLEAFGADRKTLLAWVVLRFGLPLFAAQHFFAGPDTPLSLFWLASVLALWRARESGTLGWWLASGAALGLALSSKYSAVFLIPGALVVLALDPVLRRRAATGGPWAAALVAALVFLPVVVWNARNGWASFLFQTAQRAQAAQPTLHWFGQFVALQALGLTPTIFVCLALASVASWRRWLRERAARELWLLAFGLPLVFFMTAASFAIHVKINWIMPAYGPLTLCALLWWRESRIEARRPRTARLVRGTAYAVCVLMALGPAIRFLPQVGSKHPSWSGWDEIAASALEWRAQLEQRRSGDGGVFLLAPDHRDAAELALHIWRRGGAADRAAFDDILAQEAFGENGRQFGLWAPAEERLGQDAVFVLVRPEVRVKYLEKVGARFDRVEHAARTVVSLRGRTIQAADVYICFGYRGPGRP